MRAKNKLPGRLLGMLKIWHETMLKTIFVVIYVVLLSVYIFCGALLLARLFGWLRIRR
jgi:hypothetical protein